jgi:hypothetical protein
MVGWKCLVLGSCKRDQQLKAADIRWPCVVGFAHTHLAGLEKGGARVRHLQGGVSPTQMSQTAAVLYTCVQQLP